MPWCATARTPALNGNGTTDTLHRLRTEAARPEQRARRKAHPGGPQEPPAARRGGALRPLRASAGGAPAARRHRPFRSRSHLHSALHQHQRQSGVDRHAAPPARNPRRKKHRLYPGAAAAQRRLPGRHVGAARGPVLVPPCPQLQRSRRCAITCFASTLIRRSCSAKCRASAAPCAPSASRCTRGRCLPTITGTSIPASPRSTNTSDAISKS